MKGTTEKQERKTVEGGLALVAAALLKGNWTGCLVMQTPMLPADFVCVTYEMKVHWPATVSWNLAWSFWFDALRSQASFHGRPSSFSLCTHVNAFRPAFHLNRRTDRGERSVKLRREFGSSLSLFLKRALAWLRFASFVLDWRGSSEITLEFPFLDAVFQMISFPLLFVLSSRAYSFRFCIAVAIDIHLSLV